MARLGWYPMDKTQTKFINDRFISSARVAVCTNNKQKLMGDYSSCPSLAVDINTVE